MQDANPPLIDVSSVKLDTGEEIIEVFDVYDANGKRYTIAAIGKYGPKPAPGGKTTKSLLSTRYVMIPSGAGVKDLGEGTFEIVEGGVPLEVKRPL